MNFRLGAGTPAYVQSSNCLFDRFFASQPALEGLTVIKIPGKHPIGFAT